MESLRSRLNERGQHKREILQPVNERKPDSEQQRIRGETRFTPCSNHSVYRQPTAFKSERPRISKQRFTSQVDVNNDLSKPVTTHYLPKEREYAVAKPHHMIAPGSSRYSSNDMVHKHYLEEAKKKTQESSRNSDASVMPSTRSQSTTNGSKPKPRINNQKSRNWHASKSSCVTTKTVPIAEHSSNSRSFSDSKHFVCSTCQKCVFNDNHDSCVTKFLNEVNSRAKVPSNKKTKRYIPVEQTSVAKNQKDRSQKDIVSLRWVPTGKIFTSSTTKVDCEPQNGSNDDITNQYECKQTLDVSAELGIHDHSNELSSSKLVPKVVPPADKTATSRQELELLFHHHITMLRSYALSWKPCQGDSLNLPDHRIHKDGDGDASFQLESDSLPHAHAQTTKTFHKHQDSKNHESSRIKDKDFRTNSDIKDNSSEIKLRGRLLASFQDDAKYEHVGQDTRSQGGKDDQDKQGKDLKISDIIVEDRKNNDKGSRLKITKHEGTSLQRIQRPRPQDLNDKSNLIDLMKKCHNELTSGEIVSLKILSRTMEVRSLY
ncbi:hypothetical protein Tco_0370247 [Tanacetum coccineum]